MLDQTFMGTKKDSMFKVQAVVLNSGIQKTKRLHEIQEVRFEKESVMGSSSGLGVGVAVSLFL